MPGVPGVPGVPDVPGIPGVPVVPGVPRHSLLSEVEVGLSFSSNRTVPLFGFKVCIVVLYIKL